MRNRDVMISKFLSLVLRHKPDQIGITLDKSGWVPVSVLLQACSIHGFPITRQELEAVVANNDKKRFSFSDDGLLIRANQGHSVKIQLGYQPLEPPSLLYHGTTDRFLLSIKEEGLSKGKRHHVHLSRDVATAKRVGQRHGKPVVLEVKSGQMHRDGYVFYQSANGVWLTEHVPPSYIEVIN